MSTVLGLLAPYLGDPIGSASNGNVRFRCPFHKGGQETMPSFYIHTETGLAFCHACNQGWNLIGVLSKLGARADKLDVAARVLKLAPRTVQEVREFTPIPEDIGIIVGQWCPEALLDRGFDKATMRAHGVGFDPIHDVPVYQVRDHLGRFAAMSGRFQDHYIFYDQEMLEVFFDEEKKTSDNRRFRYVTPHKSQYLWNMDKIYPRRMRPGPDQPDDAGPLVVVEGFKACLWCIQNGFPDTVALMGSYLSESQARLIERVTNRVILFLDWDGAGRRGVVRAYERLRSACTVDVAVYPSNDPTTKIQPDDLGTAVGDAIYGARPYWKRQDK